MATLGPYTFDTQGGADSLAFDYSDPIATNFTPPQSPNTSRRLCWDDNDTTSSGVGPTSGQGGNPDGYLYTEASGSSLGDEFFIEYGSSLNASTDQWQFNFYTNQRGTNNDATCQLQINESGGGWVDVGAQFGGASDPNKVNTSGTQIWASRSVDLSNSGANTDSSTLVRIKIVIASGGGAGAAFECDYGIDTIEIVGTSLGGISITPDNTSSLQSITSVTLTQHNALLVDSLSSVNLISEPTLTQNSSLIVDGIQSASDITEPSFTQANILSVNNVETQQSLSNVILSIAGALSVDSLSTLQSLSVVDFIQSNILSVDNIGNSQVVSEPSFLQHHSLIVDDLNNTQEITNASLDTGLNLIVDSISSAQSITESGLTQHNILLTDPITNTQFIGVVTLSGEGQDIGTVTVGFKEDDISVKYGILNITVKFKE